MVFCGKNPVYRSAQRIADTTRMLEGTAMVLRLLFHSSTSGCYGLLCHFSESGCFYIITPLCPHRFVCTVRYVFVKMSSKILRTAHTRCAHDEGRLGDLQGPSASS